jgi:hypothetical protein
VGVHRRSILPSRSLSGLHISRVFRHDGVQVRRGVVRSDRAEVLLHRRRDSRRSAVRLSNNFNVGRIASKVGSLTSRQWSSFSGGRRAAGVNSGRLIVRLSNGINVSRIARKLNSSRLTKRLRSGFRVSKSARKSGQTT